MAKRLRLQPLLDLQMRLGNQVINWGESVFIQGVNQFNPIDVPAARRAGIADASRAAAASAPRNGDIAPSLASVEANLTPLYTRSPKETPTPSGKGSGYDPLPPGGPMKISPPPLARAAVVAASSSA